MTIWRERQSKSDHAKGAVLYAADETLRLAELLEWVARGYTVRWTEGAISPIGWKGKQGGTE